MNWFEQQRQQWIAEMLDVVGFINRGHIMRKFGISMPRASSDLKKFMKRNPDAMTYDSAGKRYVANDSKF